MGQRSHEEEAAGSPGGAGAWYRARDHRRWPARASDRRCAGRYGHDDRRRRRRRGDATMTDVMAPVSDYPAIEQEHSIGVYATRPLTIVRGKGTTVWDDHGRAYL